MAPEVGNYKGKTKRSWPELPVDLIRSIATFYLLEVSRRAYVPRSWQARDTWYNRMIWSAIRDASELEKFMNICPQWSLAMEIHPFWSQALSLLDPLDAYAHQAIIRPHPSAMTNSSSKSLQPVRITPYRHWRNLSMGSCLICRINAPHATVGLNAAKHTIYTHMLGHCGACSQHSKHTTSYCGLCLRDPGPETNGNPLASEVSCYPNEDDKTWPGVDATCRSCRLEWLWSRISKNPRECEALGGRRLRPSDTRTRNALDSFLECGEGKIDRLLALAKDRLWLRTHTKLSDMAHQAVAASRYDGGNAFVDAYGHDPGEEDLEMDLSDLEDEDEDEDEDEPSFLSRAELGVKDAALGDWARVRILDGLWISPADLWFGQTTAAALMDFRATHPCPWTNEDASSEQDRPRRELILAEIPPSYALCEMAYQAHQRMMRSVLLPPMKNVVRRLVIECGADGVDPAMKSTRMSLDDILRELHEDMIWFDGVDWLERRRNVRREESERRIREEGSDDSSTTSSKSDGSNATSPVLSTSTLQTTPSPPPLEEHKDDAERVTRAPTIAVAPVLEAPSQLRAIPYVPDSMAHLPHYSSEAFKLVWREACAPLYHCRCNICERATVKANEASATAAASLEQQRQQGHQEVDQRGMVVSVDEISAEDIQQLQNIEDDDETSIYTSDESFFEDLEQEDEPPQKPPVLRIPSRKRALVEEEEEEEDVDAEGDSDEEASSRGRSRSSGTPPKRQRREEPSPEVPYEPRLRKRSSEELEDGNLIHDDLDKKRLKLSPIETPPYSSSASPVEELAVPRTALFAAAGDGRS